MNNGDEPQFDLLPHDPHGFFGLPFDYDPIDLRRRYNQLLRRYKPDRMPSEFQRIRAAYEYLKSISDQDGLFQVPHSGSAMNTTEIDFTSILLEPGVEDQTDHGRIRHLHRTVMDLELEAVESAWKEIQAETLMDPFLENNPEFLLVEQLVEYRRHRDDLRRICGGASAFSAIDRLMRAIAEGAVDASVAAWQDEVRADPVHLLHSLPAYHPALSAAWTSFKINLQGRSGDWQNNVNVAVDAHLRMQVNKCLGDIKKVTRRKLYGRMPDQPPIHIMMIALASATFVMVTYTKSRISVVIMGMILMAVWLGWIHSPMGAARVRATVDRLYRKSWRHRLFVLMKDSRAPVETVISVLSKTMGMREALNGRDQIREYVKDRLEKDGAFALIAEALRMDGMSNDGTSASMRSAREAGS